MRYLDRWTHTYIYNRICMCIYLYISCIYIYTWYAQISSKSTHWWCLPTKSQDTPSAVPSARSHCAPGNLRLYTTPVAVGLTIDISYICVCVWIICTYIYISYPFSYIMEFIIINQQTSLRGRFASESKTEMPSGTKPVSYSASINDEQWGPRTTWPNRPQIGAPLPKQKRSWNRFHLQRIHLAHVF